MGLQCKMNKPLTIKDMQKTAMERGGKCLSKEYVNSQTKLKWQCAEGHEWEARPNGIRKGRWCPTCFNSRRGASQRLNIKIMQEIARQRGGECLSKSYKNARSPLEWKCAEGHVWKATADYVKNQGHWCGICDKENRRKV